MRGKEGRKWFAVEIGAIFNLDEHGGSVWVSIVERVVDVELGVILTRRLYDYHFVL